MNPFDTKKTITIAELTTAFYDEALRELGDETLAHRVSTELIADYLRRQARR